MKPFWSIEPVLRRLRMGPIHQYVPSGGVLVDIGCDDPPLTINMYKDRMDHCFGLDAEVQNREYENVTLINAFFKKTIPLESDLANVITMLAVLEHLDYPQAIANELYRILKPGGVLLLTVPSPMSKPILELMAMFHVVRPEMIAQHKNYFTHENLKEIFSKAGFRQVAVESFQFGVNTFVRATK